MPAYTGDSGQRKEAMTMKVIIAGGTGSLGSSLSWRLAEQGAEVVVLTRSPRADAAAHGARDVAWDARTPGPWTAELEADGPVAVVNLAGKLVDARPTPRGIAELTRSRVEATRVLVEASRGLSRPVDRWVQASTTAIWSDAGDERLTEDSPIPVGLPQMTGVAEPWERAAHGANAEHVTVLRTSIVLDAGTPALERLLLPVKLGLGGPVGSGRQWFSWIHVEDWLRIVVATLGLGEPPLPDGVLVAASPRPVCNAELMRTLRQVSGRRIGLPTPAPLMRLAAVALRTDPELALTGRYTTSRVLEEAGFEFRYPQLEGALEDLLG